MRKTSLTIIFFTVFIDLMGFGILIPILPTFASKQLGISDFGIGIIVAVFSFVQFLFNPILGKLSDKYGRRPLILISLCSTVISYIIFAFSHSFAMLFLSRILGGFGGSNIGVAQAYIADITEKHERSKGMGLMGVAFGMGFVFGPIIGGILSKYGYMVAGIGAASLSFIAFIFAFFFLKESIKEKNLKNISRKKIFDWKFTLQTLKHPDVGLLIMLFFIITFSVANIYGTFAILGYKHYHISDQQIGYLFGVMGIVSSIVQGGFIKIISEKISEKNQIIAGTFFMMFGLGLLPYGVNFLGLVFIISLQAIGTGILQPTVLSMISKYSSEKEQGTILGINQSLSALARVLGPLWGGFSFGYLGYQFPFLTGGAFMFLTFLFSIFALDSKKYSRLNAGNIKAK
ncbi:MAG: MFS transporter [Ignavibacteriales bacterium]|nr:MFS transporter [Ignavibacteriales bacterium]